MANAGARVSTMEKRCFWIPTSPESATLLYTENTSEAHAGYLGRSLSSFGGIGAVSTQHQAWMTSFLPSSTAVAFVKSSFFQVRNWQIWQ